MSVKISVLSRFIYVSYESYNSPLGCEMIDTTGGKHLWTKYSWSLSRRVTLFFPSYTKSETRVPRGSGLSVYDFLFLRIGQNYSPFRWYLRVSYVSEWVNRSRFRSPTLSQEFNPVPLGVSTLYERFLNPELECPLLIPLPLNNFLVTSENLVPNDYQSKTFN